MKRPLWWVSESSHVERHATRGWHPNRDCDDGDLQWFFLLGFQTQKIRGILFGRYLPECVWWIPPGEKPPAPSQPGRVHHTQRAFLDSFWKDDSIIRRWLAKLMWSRFTQWVEYYHSLNLSSQMLLAKLFSSSTGWWWWSWKWRKPLQWCEKRQEESTVDCHSVVEMNYTRWWDHSRRNSPQHQNSWRWRWRRWRTERSWRRWWRRKRLKERRGEGGGGERVS